MKETKWCIYVHTNIANGKKYVGQTSFSDNPNRRWLDGNGYKQNKEFYNSIQKRGWNEGYTHEVIHDGIESKEEADSLEIYYIKLHNSRYPNGYNLTDGGSGDGCLNYKWTIEQKAKIRGENHKNYGRHLSETTRIKISEAQKGKIISDESKRNMSLAKIGKDSLRRIKVYQYDLEGNYVKEWSCAGEASKEYNSNYKTIARACRQELKSCCGFQWRYELYDKIEKYNPLTPSRESQSIKIAEIDKFGNIIKEYNSIRDASREINTCNSNITAVLKGKYKQIKGHIYIYI